MNDHGLVAGWREIRGAEYYNDGHWVEGCTALVEHFDWRMEVVHWADEIEARQAQAPHLTQLAA